MLDLNYIRPVFIAYIHSYKLMYLALGIGYCAI